MQTQKVTKRIVAFILAAVLCVAMASVCFAADNSTTNTVFCTDANGNTVELNAASGDNFTPLTAQISADLTNGTASDYTVVLDGTNSDIDSSYAGQALTFHNVGTAGTTIYAYHWNGSSWDYVSEGTIASDGTATFTFPELSPIGLSIVSGNGGGTSPGTGVTSYAIPAAALIVLAGLGIALVVKRERA